MNTSDRLHHLLAHWVEHNEAHSQTYREWAETAAREGLAAAGESLLDAIAAVETANAFLRKAAAALPEPARDVSHGHAHHHGKEHGRKDHREP